MNSVADASVWLANHVRIGQPIGIEVRADVDDDGLGVKNYLIAFSGRTEGDEIVFGGQTDDEGVKMLRRFLDTNDGIKIVPFSTPEAVVMLHLITGLAPKIILPRIVGDAFAIEYTIGRGHTPSQDPAEEARYVLSFWTGGEQVTLPKFYRQVMQPLQRIMALPIPNDGHGWMVRYSELPVKVIAKYSREPLLLRPIMDNEFPLHGKLRTVLLDVYPDITHGQTLACLWYAALGGDFDYMQMEYPDMAAEIAEWDKEALGGHLDKLIPSVRLMATTLWAAGQPAGQIETLYGRRLPFEPQRDQGPGVFLDHVIGGTVIDLIHVFCVSAFNLGVAVSVPFLKGDENTIDISGKLFGDIFERANQLKGIAALGGPLNPVPLGPTVLLEGEDGKGFKA